MKLRKAKEYQELSAPAAFRRLCVETSKRINRLLPKLLQPPSGGCVLKLPIRIRPKKNRRPAAFRRLCVETLMRGSDVSN